MINTFLIITLRKILNQTNMLANFPKPSGKIYRALAQVKILSIKFSAVFIYFINIVET